MSVNYLCWIIQNIYHYAKEWLQYKVLLTMIPILIQIQESTLFSQCTYSLNGAGKRN